jgi:ABC-type lipoprotein export system ATPase subunit
MKNNPRGSIWKKCDLHFHTPASFDHDFKAQTPQEVVDKLRTEEVSLVAVTDHYYIDPDYIQSLRDEAGESITFLPGVEFRSDLGGNKPVHIISIFSEEMDLNRLSTALKGLTNVHAEDLNDQTYMQKQYTKHEIIIKFTKKYDGLISIHAGKKHGSFEAIGNQEYCQREFKTDFLRSNVDLLDITKEADEKDYKNIVFPSTKLWLPLISGSDNHDIRTYASKLPCWMNCDASFQGLLQVINEPEERVFLGECPPSVTRAKNFPTNYIESITVSKNDGSKLNDKWFEQCSLPINPGLVSIIGNKGNGKSALSDIIALLCNSHQDESSFSFLNKQKFRHKKNGKAHHFNASMKWLTEERVGPQCLNETTNQLEPERARYIPQRYLEELCNEHDGKENFQQELQKVIYSHIPREERLGSDNLDALISYVTNETKEGISEIKQRLSKINKTIAALEEEVSETNQTRLKNEFNHKLLEYKDLLSRKPMVLPKPSEDPDQQKEVSAISKQIEGAKFEWQALKRQNDDCKKKLKQTNSAIAKLNKLDERLSNFQQQFESFLVESPEFDELSLEIEKIISLKIDHQPIKKRFKLETKKSTDLKQCIDPSVTNSIASKLDSKLKQLNTLTSKLSEPEQIYQKFLTDRIEWKNQLKALAGDKDSPETLKYIHHKISKASMMPEDLLDLSQTRLATAREIFEKKKALKDKYELYYTPVHAFIADHPLAKEHQFQLEFTVSISNHDCSEQLLGMIDQGRAGSFYGKEAGKTKLEDIIIQCDFNEADQALNFAESITKLLKTNIRNNEPQDDVNSQLVKDVSASEVYDYLFSFDYLQPVYNLSWAGKALDQLSPGERGNLLLIFYLLIDQEQAPLILDQPEDNLDNHTVYKTLVPCIRDAKKRRQIIMVTHNPNLAVVCDSDQIIHTEIKKEEDSKVLFTSGAIENPEINKRVIDVLEGTRPAFDKRDSKYIVQHLT